MGEVQAGKDRYPFGPDRLNSAAQGFTYLGGAEITAANANIPTTGGVIVPVRDLYLIYIKIVGYSVAGTVAMQIGANSVIDVGAKYRHRNIIGPGGNTLGTTIFYNNSINSTTQWDLAYNSSAVAQNDVGDLNTCILSVTISNRPGTSKIGSWTQARGTASAATAGKLFIGQGEFIDTAAGDPAINCFKLKVSTGTATMSADSGFGIWGRNFT